METLNINSNVTLVTTAETVITSSPAVSYNAPGGQGLGIHGYVNVTAGTGTTIITVRVRLGVGTGGTLVGAADIDTLAAGNSESIYYEYLDQTPIVTPAGEAGTNRYTVTVQQTGATGNGTVNRASIAVRPVTAGW